MVEGQYSQGRLLAVEQLNEGIPLWGGAWNCQTKFKLPKGSINLSYRELEAHCSHYQKTSAPSTVLGRDCHLSLPAKQSHALPGALLLNISLREEATCPKQFKFFICSSTTLLFCHFFIPNVLLKFYLHFLCFYSLLFFSFYRFSPHINLI